MAGNATPHRVRIARGWHDNANGRQPCLYVLGKHLLPLFRIPLGRRRP